MNALKMIAVLWALAVPAVADACPLCKEAISTPDSETEINHLPAAYNTSIYLMLGVPYLSLMVFGFLIVRGYRKNQEYLQTLQTAPTDPSRQPPA